MAGMAGTHFDAVCLNIEARVSSNTAGRRSVGIGVRLPRYLKILHATPRIGGSSGAVGLHHETDESASAFSHGTVPSGGTTPPASGAEACPGSTVVGQLLSFTRMQGVFANLKFLQPAWNAKQM